MISYHSRPQLVTSPLRLDIVDTMYGPGLEALTQEQLGMIARGYSSYGNGKPLKVAVIYDLPPNPKDFDTNRTNINPGRFEIDAWTIINEGRLNLYFDQRQQGILSDFLQERRQDEKDIKLTERHRVLKGIRLSEKEMERAMSQPVDTKKDLMVLVYERT